MKNILNEAGLDPEPDRGEGSWDHFLKRLGGMLKHYWLLAA